MTAIFKQDLSNAMFMAYVKKSLLNKESKVFDIDYVQRVLAKASKHIIDSYKYRIVHGVELT